MSTEPQHWSERTVSPPSPVSPGDASREPQRGRSRRGLWVLVPLLIFAIAATAIILFWYLPSRDTETAAVSTTNIVSGSGNGLTTTSAAPGLPTTAASGATAPVLSKSYESKILGCSFEYPGSWMEYTPEVALGTSFNDPTAFIVGDPNTANAEGAPSEFLLFWGLRSQEKISPEALSIMENMVEEALQNNPSPETIYEPETKFKVNGMAARSFATLETGSLGPTVTRTVIITSGDGSYIFDFCSSEIRLDTNRPIFDAILESFKPTAPTR